MAFQAVPDTVEIRVMGLFAGDPVMNTFHAEKVGGYNQSDIDQLAAAVDANYVPGLLAIQSGNFLYERTEVIGLASINDLSAADDTNGGPGTVGVGALAGHSAFVITKLSGLTGRSARGRVYVCGIPTTYRSGASGEVNMITTTAANAYLAAVDGCRIAIDNVTTWDPVIVSRYSEKVKRTTGVTFSWTSSVWKTRNLGTQRKRI